MLFTVLTLTFLVMNLPGLEYLEFDIDEGIYLQQGRLVHHGLVPFKDFFHHQTPLYLYFLSFWESLLPATLFFYRLLSILGGCITALLIFMLARQKLPGHSAILASFLFYFSPLMHFASLALPNSLIVACVMAAVYIILCHPGISKFFLAGLISSIAMLLKPIAFSSVLAIGLVLLISRTRMRYIFA